MTLAEETRVGSHGGGLPAPLGAVAMRKYSTNCFEQDGVEALSLMEEALAILDRTESNLDVGAHLDLAICRLREVLGPLAPIKASAANDHTHAQAAGGSA